MIVDMRYFARIQFLRILVLRKVFRFFKLEYLFCNKLMAWWLGRGIPNPGVPVGKLLAGSRVDSTFHPSEVDQTSTRYSWRLNGKKYTVSWQWLCSLEKKKRFGPFLWMGFNCLKTTEPLRGGSVLCTTKFPKLPGTHLIDLGRMKC